MYIVYIIIHVGWSVFHSLLLKWACIHQAHTNTWILMLMIVRWPVQCTHNTHIYSWIYFGRYLLLRFCDHFCILCGAINVVKGKYILINACVVLAFPKISFFSFYFSSSETWSLSLFRFKFVCIIKSNIYISVHKLDIRNLATQHSHMRTLASTPYMEILWYLTCIDPRRIRHWIGSIVASDNCMLLRTKPYSQYIGILSVAMGRSVDRFVYHEKCTSYDIDRLKPPIAALKFRHVQIYVIIIYIKVRDLKCLT